MPINQREALHSSLCQQRNKKSSMGYDFKITCRECGKEMHPMNGLDSPALKIGDLGDVWFICGKKRKGDKGCGCKINVFVRIQAVKVFKDKK